MPICAVCSRTDFGAGFSVTRIIRLLKRDRPHFSSRAPSPKTGRRSSGGGGRRLNLQGLSRHSIMARVRLVVRVS